MEVEDPWMAAILLSGPNQGLHIVASVSSSRALQACPRHRYSQRAAQYIRTLCQIIDAPGSPSELIVFIALLLVLPCSCVMFCCVIFEKCFYTCADTHLHTLISCAPVLNSMYLSAR